MCVEGVGGGGVHERKGCRPPLMLTPTRELAMCRLALDLLLTEYTIPLCDERDRERERERERVVGDGKRGDEVVGQGAEGLGGG